MPAEPRRRCWLILRSIDRGVGRSLHRPIVAGFHLMRHQWRDGYDDGHGAAQVPNTTGGEPCSHGEQSGEQAIWQKSTTLGCIGAYQAAPHSEHLHGHPQSPSPVPCSCRDRDWFRTSIPSLRPGGRGGCTSDGVGSDPVGRCWSAEPNRDGLSQQEIVQGQIGLGGDKTALWSLAPHRSPTSNCREVEAVIRRKMGERGKQEDRRACDVRRATDARSRKSTTNARPHALFGGGLVNPAH